MSYAHSVIDSYTGLPWCGAGLHLLEEGKNASRRTGKLHCLACEARKTRQARRRARLGSPQLIDGIAARPSVSAAATPGRPESQPAA